LGVKIKHLPQKNWELKKGAISVSNLTFKVKWERITSKLGGFIALYCKENARILDVGAGDGSFYSYIEKVFGYYIGLDPSVKMLAGFKENISKRAVQGCAENLPVADGKFDILIFNSSLDHCMDPDAALREARRALNAGGRIFILLTNKGAWYKKIFGTYAKKMRDIDVDHNFHFTFKDIKVLLEKNNFHDVRVRSFDFLRLPVSVENILQKTIPNGIMLKIMDFFDHIMGKIFTNKGGSFMCTGVKI